MRRFSLGTETGLEPTGARLATPNPAEAVVVRPAGGETRRYRVPAAAWARRGVVEEF